MRKGVHVPIHEAIAMRTSEATKRRTLILLSAMVLAPGCRREDSRVGAATAADSAVLLSTDTLAWYREGRPVEFAGRVWVPSGKPVALDTVSVHAIGEFEGMLVYAARNEEAATARYLLFPLTDSLWQALEPADSSQIPRSTGTGSGPE